MSDFSDRFLCLAALTGCMVARKEIKSKGKTENTFTETEKSRSPEDDLHKRYFDWGAGAEDALLLSSQ